MDRGGAWVSRPSLDGSGMIPHEGELALHLFEGLFYLFRLSLCLYEIIPTFLGYNIRYLIIRSEMASEDISPNKAWTIENSFLIGTFCHSSPASGDGGFLASLS